MALGIDPDDAEAHNELGIALARVPGRLPAAVAEFQQAALLKPDFANAHQNFGIALSHIPGYLSQAVSELEAAYRLHPEPTLRLTLDQLRGVGRASAVPQQSLDVNALPPLQFVSENSVQYP